MEKLVYKSEFQKIYFLEQDKIFEVSWTNTAIMSDEVYRQELKKQLACYQSYEGKGTLLNTSNFEFVISNETQEWTGQYIFPKASEAGVQYVAVLVTQEFFAQLSIELNMDEDSNQLFTTKYFDATEEAKKWLKTNI